MPTFIKTGFWDKLSSAPKNYLDLDLLISSLAPPVTDGIGVTLDGQGSGISIGSKGFVTIPYACIINEWFLSANISGSIVIDVKRGGTSIIGAGNKPTLASAISGNAVVSGWTSTSIAVGDIIEWNVDSASTISNITLTIKVTK